MDRQSGAAAVEYAILVGLIAVVIIGAVGALGMAIFPEERVDQIVEVLDGEDSWDEQPGNGKGKGKGNQGQGKGNQG
jgi:Flp pilus assembly pilin Flp